LKVRSDEQSVTVTNSGKLFHPCAWSSNRKGSLNDLLLALQELKTMQTAVDGATLLEQQAE